MTIAHPARGADDGNWPQWRGPAGLGISTDTSFVTEWTPSSNIKWRTEIPGRGHSSPVVWGDRIFLTTSIKGEHVPGRKAPVHLGFDRLPGYLHPDATDVDYKHTLQVLALDTTSGRILWTRTAYEGLMADDRHRSNTYASPTVVTDGQLAYAFFESAGLYAYDFNGTLVWNVSLGGIIKAGLGPGTSPVLYGGLIIVQCDQEMGDGSFIVGAGSQSKRAFAVRLGGTGNLTDTRSIVWRYNKGTAYVASPILVGQYVYLLSDAGLLTCLDVDSGERLYEGGRVPVPASFRASPVAFGDVLLLTSEDGDTFVVKAGPKHEVLRTNAVDEPVWASPALSRGTIYIRGDRHLFAIGRK